MSLHEKPELNAKQNATNPMSAAARLDRLTEEALYTLYRAYFKTAEDERRWNVWEDIPWDAVKVSPSPELIAAVMAIYREDLFLPDFSAKSLHILRSSRGRAWFITRWSYEESKHLIALTDWLVRAGVFTDDELKQYADDLLTRHQWEPPFNDGTAVLWDALLWETREIERYRHLMAQAKDADDAALVSVIEHLLADEQAHRGFFRDSIRIIAERHRENVAEAAQRVAGAQEFEGGAAGLLALLD